MANSVTRAHTRRRTALAAAMRDVVEALTGYRPTDDEADQLADALTTRLDSHGLCVTDIGGQQVDDDTVHRTEVDRPDPTRVTRRGLL